MIFFQSVPIWRPKTFLKSPIESDGMHLTMTRFPNLDSGCVLVV